MRLHIPEVTWVGCGTLWGEDEVVLAPDDQSRWLILSKEGLELRIERHISLIAVEQIQLDLGIPRAVQPDLIQRPGRWIQQRAVGHAVFILPSRRFRIDQETDGLSILRCRIVPVFLDWIPELPEAFIVSVAVWHDQRLHAIGTPQ